MRDERRCEIRHARQCFTIVTFSETRLPKHPRPGERCPPSSRSTLLLSMTASKASMQSTADKIFSLQYGNIASTASTPMLPSRGGSTITLNNSAASVASKMLASRRELARTCPASNLAQTSFDTKTQITTRRTRTRHKMMKAPSIMHSSFLMCSPRFFSTTVKPSRKGFVERPPKSGNKNLVVRSEKSRVFGVPTNFGEQPARHLSGPVQHEGSKKSLSSSFPLALTSEIATQTNFPVYCLQQWHPTLVVEHLQPVPRPLFFLPIPSEITRTERVRFSIHPRPESPASPRQFSREVS